MKPHLTPPDRFENQIETALFTYQIQIFFLVYDFKKMLVFSGYQQGLYRKLKECLLLPNKHHLV